MIQITDELAVKLSGKKADELKTLLYDEEGKPKDDAGATFATLVTEKFREVERDRAENAYKKGIKEKAESIEAVLRPLFKKHSIEADKVEDAISELSDKLKNVSAGEPGKPGKPQDLTADDIRKLPAYQSLLDSELEKVQSKAQEWEQKYNTYVADVQRREVLSVARDRALSLLDQKGAVWGQDKVKQLDYFFRAIGTDGLSLDEEKNPVLRDADGNPLRDGSRNKVDFDSWLLDNWKAAGYTFHDAPPGSGSAGAQRGEGGAGSSKVVINSPEHYNKLLQDAGSDLGKKSEIRAAYRDFLAKQE